MKFFRLYSKKYGMSEPFPLMWSEIEFHHPKDGGASVIYYPTDIMWLSEMRSLPIMQYTGMKDANGKRIFEGDILRYIRQKWNCFDHPQNGRDLIDFVKVYWSKENYAFRADYFENNLMERCVSSGYLQFEDRRAEKNIVEIIGNIHEGFKV